MKIKKSDLINISDVLFNYMLNLSEYMDYDSFAKEEHTKVEELYEKINKILKNN